MGQMYQNSVGGQTGYAQMNPYSMGGQNSMGGQTGMGQMYPSSMGGQNGMGQMYHNSMDSQTGMGQMYPNSMAGQTGMGENYQAGETGYGQVEQYGSQNSPIMMASASAEVASNPQIPNRSDSTPTDYKKK